MYALSHITVQQVVIQNCNTVGGGGVGCYISFHFVVVSLSSSGALC